jgi:hypothetical protein
VKEVEVLTKEAGLSTTVVGMTEMGPHPASMCIGCVDDGHKRITPLFFAISSIQRIAHTIDSPSSASEGGRDVPVVHRALYEGSEGRTRAVKSF